jgi:Zn-dependent M28 family amino/carboxypeptidase
MTSTTLLTVATLAIQAPQQPPAALDEVRLLSVAQTNDERFDALTGLLRSHGVTFSVEPFTPDKPSADDPRPQGRNVVASFGAGDTQIVIGAHYDAVRLADGSLSRGAVDNAGSAIMLVRLAEALRNERLTARVRLVWFDMEEVGLVGSAKFVAAHAGDRIAAMINFDINAYGNTTIFFAPPGGDDPKLREAFLDTCAAEALDCLRFQRFPNSDDRSFAAARIPTLSVAQLPALEAHQLWLLMHAGNASGLPAGFEPAVLKTIHTANDVVGKVDAATLDRVQRLTLALVKRLAN